MDLEEDEEFTAQDVDLISIAFDPPEVQAAAAAEYGIGSTPMLSDAGGEVSAAYDVLQWAVATGEPGHTFVLVDGEGKVAWIQDYGHPENRGVMYVEASEITAEVAQALSR